MTSAVHPAPLALTRRQALVLAGAGAVAIALPRLPTPALPGPAPTGHLERATWAALVGQVVTLHGDDGEQVPATIAGLSDYRAGAFGVRFETSTGTALAGTVAVTHPRTGTVPLAAMAVGRGAGRTFEAIVNTTDGGHRG